MSPDPEPQGTARGWGFFALPNDDPRKIVAVAVTVCLVCSVLVASASVSLRPLQKRNQALAVKQEIVKVAGFRATRREAEQLFSENIETRILDLDTGEYLPGIDPATFDARAAARDPDTSIALDNARDPAKIGRRANQVQVYLVEEAQRLKTVILPVYGAGLWSTMYGFIALDADGRTITGLTFYEHAETPGLGDAIEKPDWLGQFNGKLAYDEDGAVQIGVIRGMVDPGSAAAPYQVDGIAGATLTSNGVTNLLRFWLGELGYQRYLKRLQTTGDRV